MDIKNKKEISISLLESNILSFVKLLDILKNNISDEIYDENKNIIDIIYNNNEITNKLLSLLKKNILQNQIDKCETSDIRYIDTKQTNTIQHNGIKNIDLKFNDTIINNINMKDNEKKYETINEIKNNENNLIDEINIELIQIRRLIYQNINNENFFKDTNNCDENLKKKFMTTSIEDKKYLLEQIFEEAEHIVRYLFKIDEKDIHNYNKKVSLIADKILLLWLEKKN